MKFDVVDGIRIKSDGNIAVNRFKKETTVMKTSDSMTESGFSLTEIAIVVVALAIVVVMFA